MVLNAKTQPLVHVGDQPRYTNYLPIMMFAQPTNGNRVTQSLMPPDSLNHGVGELDYIQPKIAL